MNESTLPNVIIFRNELLRPSETFIRNQAEALIDFTPHYVGSSRTSGIELPMDRTHYLHGKGHLASLRRFGFYLLRVAPKNMAPLRALDPKLIHAHFGPDGVTALPLARRLQVPLIVTFHGYDATTTDDYARRSFPRHRLYIRWRHNLIARGCLFIAVSDFVRSRMLESGFPPGRVIVHYIGVDHGVFRHEVVNRSSRVLFVGRLVANKGCRYLLQAMELVQRACPLSELVIIGDGPDRAMLEEYAANRHIQVQFLGARPAEDVRHWMSRSRLLCVPSVRIETGASEGFGLVSIEAQAMGLPVVGFRTGGIPETLVEGQTGLLAASGDWVGLAGRITSLLSDPGLAAQMGEAGRQLTQRRFDLRRQTARLEQLYRSVIDDYSSGACAGGSVVQRYDAEYDGTDGSA